MKLPENVFRVNSVPFDWLFPRMAAVAHHGGAGTTATGLRAGVPSIILPFFADQFFWGWRVYELGGGPRAIPRKKLTSDNLAAAIRQAVNDHKIVRSASELGTRIRAEDGIGNAVKIIESIQE
jgi:sterol 3beta-glucosyltransferase